MRTKTLLLSALLLVGFSLCAQDDKTESPFFEIENDLPEDFDPNDFALIDSKVSVHLSGVIADITVEQEYANTSEFILNSTYVFPGSSQSAIYAMEMELNGRIIQAQIKEKVEAKKIFDDAKKQGKSASLLSQHRPNVFQMSVANIQPNSSVFVRFKYTEVLIPRNKTYEFVFPSLVGPRYANQAMAMKDSWVQNPYVNSEAKDYQGKRPTFTIDLNLQAGMKINQAAWFSHPQAAVEFLNEDQLRSSIANSDNHSGDFTFRYQLAGEEIASGLLLHEGEKENFFLYTMQPPARPSQGKTPPRDYIFIVDVSGSMSGFPIEVSKRLISSILLGLRPEDRFNILLFAGSSEQFEPGLVSATESNVRQAVNFVHNQNGGGGTNILPALERSMDMIEDEGRSSTVIIATDGLVTVEREAIALIEDNLGKANFFPFGIGASSNRYMIEALAHAGMTEAFLCASEQEALKKAKEFQALVTNPILTDISVKFKGIKTYDVLPKRPHDLFGDKPLVLFGKYKSETDGMIQVKGQNADGEFKEELNFRSGEKASKNKALEYLWARQKIKMLSDYNRAEPSGRLKEHIITLGLDYNLLTEFTSFVAVDDSQDMNSPDTLKPASINNSSGAVPEPGEWSLIMIGILLLAFLFFTRIHLGR